MWRNEGLTDESLLVFPSILIFATVIANFTLSIWLLILMSVNIAAIGIVNYMGIYTNVSNQSNLDTAFVLIAILFLVTFSVSLISRDLNILLGKLGKENYKVKQSKQEILRLQNHDPLTGLPNRILAKEILEQRAQLGLRENFETALMFIDLDNFKSINDTLGHSAGDKFLQSVGQRLKEQVRQTDTVCRLSGDEFVIVAHHHREEMLGSVLASKILQALKEPIELEGNQVSLSASIGIAISPQDGVDFDTLSQKADQAMYRAKDSGKNNYSYYNKDMTTDNMRQLKIAQELRKALPENQLSLNFQTKHSLSTNDVTGAEALLRWQHPDLGNISPVEFIPIAEKSGAIHELGEWVLSEAIRACSHWHDLGYEKFPISVNVSSIQFKRGRFELLVKNALAQHKLEGKYLILELTESMLFDIKQELADSMQSILAMGVRLAIDDFGTGYSNLGYLQKFDISMLKIDRSFVAKMNDSRQDLAIVEAIINMSKSLNMEIVAEGIETQEIQNELLRLGCPTGQGYFWTKPVDEIKFLSCLAKTDRDLDGCANGPD